MILEMLQLREDFERMSDGTIEIFDAWTGAIRTTVPAFLSHLF